MTCPKKIVTWVPHASTGGTFGIATCTEEGSHEDHTGPLGEYEGGVDGLTPGEMLMRYPTQITWMTMDRRCFEGDLVLCTVTRGCVCPAGHRGRCAP